MSGINSSKIDKRIIKTKQAVRDALFTLLFRKPLALITVTELAREANINRKTFYTYYDTVNDVLDEAMDEVQKEITTFLMSMYDDYNMISPNSFYTFMNSIAKADSQTKRLLSSANGSLLLEKISHSLQLAMINTMEKSKDMLSIDKTQYSFVASFISGGIISAYREWLTNPKNISSDDFSSTISDLIAKGILSIATLNTNFK